MTTVDADYSLADMFRATASLIRLEHGPRCPDLGEWRRRAAVLDEAADRLDAGGRVDTAEAEQIAVAYLGAARPAVVSV